MKTILFLMLLMGMAQADVYVVTNQSGNVYAISNQPDIIVPSTYTQTILKGQDISNLPITGSPQLYNFINGAFVLNATAVQAQQAQQTVEIAAKSVRQAHHDSAISKLKGLGLTDDEIEALR